MQTEIYFDEMVQRKVVLYQGENNEKTQQKTLSKIQLVKITSPPEVILKTNLNAAALQMLMQSVMNFKNLGASLGMPLQGMEGMTLKRPTRFFISNTFIRNTRLKLAKNKEKLSNTLRLNFCYLKSNHPLHPCFYFIFSDYLKNDVLKYILKNVHKNKCVYFSEIN